MGLLNRIEELEKELLELKELVKQEQKFPQFGDDYWYVDSDTDVLDIAWYDGEYDQGRLSIGNVFKTKEEAEFVAEKLRVESELREFSKSFDTDSLTFTICFDVEENELYSETRRFMSQGSIYFGWGQAEEAMDAVGRERIKKYIFGMED